MLLRCCYGAVTVVFFLKNYTVLKKYKKYNKGYKNLKNAMEEIWRLFVSPKKLTSSIHDGIYMHVGWYIHKHSLTLFCMHVGLRDLMLALNMH